MSLFQKSLFEHSAKLCCPYTWISTYALPKTSPFSFTTKSLNLVHKQSELNDAKSEFLIKDSLIKKFIVLSISDQNCL